MQARPAKEFTFTINEAIDALMKMAKEKGEPVPPMETAHVNVDSQKNVVKVLIISPVIIPGGQGGDA